MINPVVPWAQNMLSSKILTYIGRGIARELSEIFSLKGQKTQNKSQMHETAAESKVAKFHLQIWYLCIL